MREGAGRPRQQWFPVCSGPCSARTLQKRPIQDTATFTCLCILDFPNGIGRASTGDSKSSGVAYLKKVCLREKDGIIYSWCGRKAQVL